MTTTKTIGLTALILALAGCVAAPPPQELPAIPANADHALGRHEALDMTSHMQGHLDERREIVYLQSQGGGGAALGLALGPLGVMANAQAIKETTRADLDRLGGQVVADVPAAFMKASAQRGFSLSDATDSFVEVSPYVLVTRVNDTEIRYAAAMMLSTDEAGIEWSGKFVSELPLRNTLDDAAAGIDFENDPELRAMLVDGFDDVIDLYQRDRAGQLGEGQERKIKSLLLSPRHDFELTVLQLPSHAPEKMLFRLPGGIFSLEERETRFMD